MDRSKKRNWENERSNESKNYMMPPPLSFIIDFQKSGKYHLRIVQNEAQRIWSDGYPVYNTKLKSQNSFLGLRIKPAYYKRMFLESLFSPSDS